MTLHASELYGFRSKGGIILATVELGNEERDLEICADWYEDEEIGTGRTGWRPEVTKVLLDGQQIEVKGDLEARLEEEL